MLHAVRSGAVVARPARRTSVVCRASSLASHAKRAGAVLVAGAASLVLSSAALANGAELSASSAYEQELLSAIKARTGNVEALPEPPAVKAEVPEEIVVLEVAGEGVPEAPLEREEIRAAAIAESEFAQESAAAVTAVPSAPIAQGGNTSVLAIGAVVVIGAVAAAAASNGQATPEATPAPPAAPAAVSTTPPSEPPASSTATDASA